MKKVYDYSRSNNSSADSIGEDLSFDDSDCLNGSENFNSTYNANASVDLKTLKNKKDLYVSKKSSINKKKKQLENDKKFSRWTSVYYTFFNNNMNNNITLNELDLRCKFCFKCDETEKQSKRSMSENKLIREGLSIHENQVTSLADLKGFIDKYSSKRRENFFSKIFKRKRNNNKLSKTQITRDFNLFKTHNPVPKNSTEKFFIDSNGRPLSFNTMTPPDNNFVSLLKKEIEKTQIQENARIIKTLQQKTEFENNAKSIEASSRKNIENKESINNNFTPNPINPPKVFSQKRLSILSSYEIKDAENILNSFNNRPKSSNNDNKPINLKIKQIKSSKNNKQNKAPIDLENFNNVISNKHSFIVELDRYSAILKKKKNSLRQFEHLIDYRDAEDYFDQIASKNHTLLRKFGSELEKVDTTSRRVQAFTTNILEKLDSAKKVEI